MHANFGLLLLIIICWPIPCVAQDAIEPTPFSSLGLDEATAILNSVDQLPESIGNKTLRGYYVAPLVQDSIVVFMYRNNGSEDEAYYYEIRPKNEDLLIVRLSSGNSAVHKGFLSINTLGSVNLERSYILNHDEALFLVIRKGFYSHHEHRIGLSFFHVLKDSSEYLGHIEIGTATGADAAGWYSDQDFYSNLSLFLDSPEGISFTQKVSLPIGNYDKEYLLTQDELMLVKDHKPTFFTSYEEAENEFNRIMEEYYSEYWKAEMERNGSRARAQEFEHRFLELREKRSDFAPAHYNLACMRAIIHGSADSTFFTTQVYKSLKKAFALDPTYKEKAILDPDLEGFRKDERFEKLYDRWSPDVKRAQPAGIQSLPRQ